MSGKVLTGYRHDEEWRPVPGYEGRYEASSLGRIKALAITRVVGGRCHQRKEKLLRLTATNTGYYVVTLYNDEGKPRRIGAHQVIARTFIGDRPNGAHVLHGDGSRTNNAAVNLRYGTPADNAADARSHGTWLRGERTRSVKLTAAVASALKALQGRVPQLWVAKATGLRQSSVHAAMTGATWKHVQAVEGPLAQAIVAAYPDAEAAGRIIQQELEGSR